MSNKRTEINSWVEKYSDHLFSWALHKTSSKETAEDLVQDTFLIAFRSYDKFQKKSNPKTWLVGILNNKINDYYRSQYKSLSTSESSLPDSLFDSGGHWTKGGTPENWFESDEEHLLDNLSFKDVLQKCMERLPKNWFSVVNLKYLEEKKGNEICQDLEITNTNYWQILHRAKLQLRKCLELNWFTK